METGNAGKAVNLLYDALFPSYFYQQKRHLVCSRLVELVNGVPSNTCQPTGLLAQPALRVYYLLFAVLKSLDHRIRFEEYAKVVADRANYLLKRKVAAQFRKAYTEGLTSEVKI